MHDTIRTHSRTYTDDTQKRRQQKRESSTIANQIAAKGSKTTLNENKETKIKTEIHAEI